MKVVEQSRRGIESSGLQETVSFTIEAKGKIIRNLITSIYSQKEKTVVRELMANAFDAMVAANKSEESIDVFLPTAFDPRFIVRDYGIGMSHEFVMRLFSVLGLSTKEDTNDQTGMFGIGSKSPLSICDTFTVRCFDPPGWNGSPHFMDTLDLNESGRIRLYTVSITDADVPQISHTFDVLPREEDAVEQGGVEVSVPISTSNRSNLLEGISSQHFCWFDKNVNFGGAIDDVKYKFFSSIDSLTDNLYIAHPSQDKAPSYGYAKWNVFARQGAAVYPIDELKLRSTDNPLSETYMSVLKTFCDKGRYVMIDLPLGTADVTMAREDIQYNATTTRNIIDAFSRTLGNFTDTLRETIGEEYNVGRCLEKILPLYGSDVTKEGSLHHLYVVSAILPLFIDQIRENYKTYHDSLPDIPGMSVMRDEEDNVIKGDDGNPIYEESMVRPPYYEPSLSTTLNHRNFPEGKVLLHTAKLSQVGDVRLVIDSSAKTSITFTLPSVVYIIPSHLQKWQDRLQAHALKHFSKEDLPPGNSSAIRVQIIRCAKRYADTIKKLLVDMGIATKVFGNADIPEIYAETAKVRNSSKTSVYLWEGNAWSEKKYEPDYDSPAYYMVRVNISHEVYTTVPGQPSATIKMMRNRFTNYDIERIIALSRKLGILDTTTPIHRVTENQANRIRASHPEWTHLPDFLGKHVEDNAESPTRAAFMDSQLVMSSMSYELSEMIDAYLSGSTYNYGTDIVTLEALKEILDICLSDSVFSSVISTRIAKKKYASVFAETSKVDQKNLYTQLFGNSQAYPAHEKENIDRLTAEFDKRYGFLNDTLSRARYSGFKHVQYYMRGFSTEIRNFPEIDLNIPEAAKCVEWFRGMLDIVENPVEDAA